MNAGVIAFVVLPVLLFLMAWVLATVRERFGSHRVPQARTLTASVRHLQFAHRRRHSRVPYRITRCRAQVRAHRAAPAAQYPLRARIGVEFDAGRSGCPSSRASTD